MFLGFVGAENVGKRRQKPEGSHLNFRWAGVVELSLQRFIHLSWRLGCMRRLGHVGRLAQLPLGDEFHLVLEAQLELLQTHLFYLFVFG
jgi:hypothetical protein